MTWKPVKLTPFIERKTEEQRTEGITLLVTKRYRLTLQPLRDLRDRFIAPRLEWIETLPGTFKAGIYRIDEGLTHDEPALLFVSGIPIGECASLAKAMRHFEWVAFRANK